MRGRNDDCSRSSQQQVMKAKQEIVEGFASDDNINVSDTSVLSLNPPHALHCMRKLFGM